MRLEVAHVVSAIEEVLASKDDQHRVNPDTLLSDLSFDSLDFAEVFVVLEERLGSEISMIHLDGGTIRDLHRVLSAGAASEP